MVGGPSSDMFQLTQLLSSVQLQASCSTAPAPAQQHPPPLQQTHARPAALAPAAGGAGFCLQAQPGQPASAHWCAAEDMDTGLVGSSHDPTSSNTPYAHQSLQQQQAAWQQQQQQQQQSSWQQQQYPGQEQAQLYSQAGGHHAHAQLARNNAPPPAEDAASLAAQGSYLCQRCGGIVSMRRREAHEQLWCQPQQ